MHRKLSILQEWPFLVFFGGGDLNLNNLYDKFFLFQIIWERERDRRWRRRRNKLKQQHWKIFQPIYPDFCDFYWSGFLWLVFFRISVNLLIQTDFCDYYSSRFLNFIDPDFSDFYWSGFGGLLLIWNIDIFLIAHRLTWLKPDWTRHFFVLNSLWTHLPYLCVYKKYTHQYALNFDF